VNEDLKFVYYQKKVLGRMRPIIFQDGKIYTSDDERDTKGNWCIFNIHVELDEDTFINKGTRLKVDSFQLLKNNPDSVVYAYNFKRDYSKNKRYRPLSLECNIQNETTYNFSLLKKITNHRLSLTESKN
jgi:hypothetical protein